MAYKIAIMGTGAVGALANTPRNDLSHQLQNRTLEHVRFNADETENGQSPAQPWCEKPRWNAPK
jgi:hypothetical protein